MSDWVSEWMNKEATNLWIIEKENSQIISRQQTGKTLEYMWQYKNYLVLSIQNACMNWKHKYLRKWGKDIKR